MIWPPAPLPPPPPGPHPMLDLIVGSFEALRVPFTSHALVSHLTRLERETHGALFRPGQFARFEE